WVGVCCCVCWCVCVCLHLCVSVCVHVLMCTQRTGIQTQFMYLYTCAPVCVCVCELCSSPHPVKPSVLHPSLTQNLFSPSEPCETQNQVPRCVCVCVCVCVNVYIYIYMCVCV